MWQIMWMLSFIPDWFWILLLCSGFVAIIAARFLKLYAIPLKIGGAIAIVASIWFLGGAANEAKWQAKVAEMEEKVKEAEAKSGEANTKIETKIVEKTKVVKEKGEEIIKYIDRYNDREVIKTLEGPERVRIEEVIKYIEKCPVPKEIVDAHNAAALMNKAAEGDKK
jgi:hypothetical protein